MKSQELHTNFIQKDNDHLVSQIFNYFVNLKLCIVSHAQFKFMFSLYSLSIHNITLDHLM